MTFVSTEHQELVTNYSLFINLSTNFVMENWVEQNKTNYVLIYMFQKEHKATVYANLSYINQILQLSYIKIILTKHVL